MVDGELQGRACGHRQGAGGAPLPDDRRRRFRRHRRSPRPIRPGRPATRSFSTAGVSARPISAPTAQKARVKGDWLVRLPASMSARDAMAIGTAGYTAMLSVMALERSGLTPARGPVVVTGAAGGVGSVAVALLAKLGYAVTASTGRPDRSRLSQGTRRRPRSSSARNFPARRGRSPRSAGPAASTRSARRRSPMCFR